MDNKSGIFLEKLELNFQYFRGTNILYYTFVLSINFTIGKTENNFHRLNTIR